MMREGFAVAAVAVLIVAGVAFSPCRPDLAPVDVLRGHGTVQNAPDWTVAPCSLWADDATPTLPAFTLPDVCVTPDGAISVAAIR